MARDEEQKSKEARTAVNSLSLESVSVSFGCSGAATPETEDLLKKSREQYSVTPLLLATVYLRRGSISEAVDELRSYMAQPNVEGKEKVQCMVRKLTEPEGTVACAMR